MKPSEFYENHWKINGESPPPLTDKQKEFLDKSVTANTDMIVMYSPRRRPITVNIEAMKEDMNKFPEYFIPANQPNLDKWGNIISQSPNTKEE